MKKRENEKKKGEKSVKKKIIRKPIIQKIIRKPIISRKPIVINKEFNSLLYLTSLISDKEEMIFLYGANPHIVQIRTHSSREKVENRVRAWIDRKKAEEILCQKYWRKGAYKDIDGIQSIVWIRK